MITQVKDGFAVTKIILLPKLSVISNMAYLAKSKTMTNDQRPWVKGKSEKLFIFEETDVPNGVFTVMIHQTLGDVGPILCD